MERFDVLNFKGYQEEGLTGSTLCVIMDQGELYGLNHATIYVSMYILGQLCIYPKL